jgi:RNA polymerase sigma factor (sigma-70 family)
MQAEYDHSSAEETARLVRGFLRGDRSVVQQTRLYVQPLIRCQIVMADDWEDLQQHCLMELYQYLEKTKDIRTYWGLARRITINSIIDYNVSTRKRLDRFRTAQPQSSPEGDRIESAADMQPSALQRVAAKDELRYILAMIDEKCRKIFQLLFIKNFAPAAAAQHLGITEGNLRVRLSRCRDHAAALRSKMVR